MNGYAREMRAERTAVGLRVEGTTPTGRGTLCNIIEECLRAAHDYRHKRAILHGAPPRFDVRNEGWLCKSWLGMKGCLGQPAKKDR